MNKMILYPSFRFIAFYITFLRIVLLFTLKVNMEVLFQTKATTSNKITNFDYRFLLMVCIIYKILKKMLTSFEL